MIHLDEVRLKYELGGDKPKKKPKPKPNTPRYQLAVPQNAPISGILSDATSINHTNWIYPASDRYNQWVKEGRKQDNGVATSKTGRYLVATNPQLLQVDDSADFVYALPPSYNTYDTLRVQAFDQKNHYLANPWGSWFNNSNEISPLEFETVSKSTKDVGDVAKRFLINRGLITPKGDPSRDKWNRAKLIKVLRYTKPYDGINYQTVPTKKGKKK